jgi:hypothetical protein
VLGSCGARFVRPHPQLQSTPDYCPRAADPQRRGPYYPGRSLVVFSLAVRLIDVQLIFEPLQQVSTILVCGAGALFSAVVTFPDKRLELWR